MFCKDRLYGALNAKGISVPEFARLLGINKTTLYRKITGETDFYRREVEASARILGKEAAFAIFFAQEVTETEL